MGKTIDMRNIKINIDKFNHKYIFKLCKATNNIKEKYKQSTETEYLQTKEISKNYYMQELKHK